MTAAMILYIGTGVAVYAYLTFACDFSDRPDNLPGWALAAVLLVVIPTWPAFLLVVAALSANKRKQP